MIDGHHDAERSKADRSYQAPAYAKFTQAKKKAATPAAATSTMELPSELAAPVKGVMGELVGRGPEMLWSDEQKQDTTNQR